MTHGHLFARTGTTRFYVPRWIFAGRRISTADVEKGLMTDPGLNHRLRQRSRRAGFMIGISMLFTIAVCVGSFSIIYAGLDDVVGDFVSRADPDPTQMPTQTPATVAEAAPTEPAEPKPTEPADPEPTRAASDNQLTPTPKDEKQDGEFDPDYQIDSFGSVNLRSGPGTRFEAVTSLPMEQPIEYLDEPEATTDPANDDLGEGQVWMKFRTESGEEGWIREIAVTDYVP